MQACLLFLYPAAFLCSPGCQNPQTEYKPTHSILGTEEEVSTQATTDAQGTLATSNLFTVVSNSVGV